MNSIPTTHVVGYDLPPCGLVCAAARRTRVGRSFKAGPEGDIGNGLPLLSEQPFAPTDWSFLQRQVLAVAPFSPGGVVVADAVETQQTKRE